MSVKDAILAILTLGPAYGLQLRDELVARAPTRAGINVGQIYSTLDRLSRTGRIEAAGSTDDGLALYGLTAAGRTAAETWLRSVVDFDSDAWADMIEHVLVASSITGADIMAIIAGYERAWSAERAAADGDRAGASQLIALSRRARADAALDWLAAARPHLSGGGTIIALSTDRRRRGRPAGASMRRSDRQQVPAEPIR